MDEDSYDRGCEDTLEVCLSIILKKDKSLVIAEINDFIGQLKERKINRYRKRIQVYESNTC